ncbi:MAG: ABC transporter permease, partial [Candidatus Acidiferrales bacterium]
METLWQDVKYGVRMLAKSPGFTLVAVITLALGIGANTAIFSMMDAVMLKSLPVKSPEQLYLIAHSGKIGAEETSNFPLYKQIRDHSQSFSGVIAINPNQWKVAVGGETELVSGQVVTGNYYAMLGVNAVLGHTLTAANDEPPGGHPVAVISYSYWTRRFARDPGILGRQIAINRKPFTIVGVTSPEFFGLQVGRSTDITVPMSMHPQVGSGAELENSAGLWPLTMVGRLNPGVSAEQARTELDPLLQRFLDQSGMRPQTRENWVRRIELIPASNGLAELRNQFSEPLRLLMAIVGLVLLIACANVANLLLARADARQREIAIRLALGGSRFRLIRQLLSEGALLGLMGGGLGLLFASWAADYLVHFIPQKEAPLTLPFSPDLRILSFTFALLLVTSILFGLVPALQATKVDLNPALKGDRRGVGSVRARVRLGKLLVVAQAAISLILLVGAG